MAEYGFAEVIRQWKRLCDYMDALYKDQCCEKCTLKDYNCGGIFEMSAGCDWDGMALKIMAWAKENPELVYPTWGEWFAERGDLIKSWQHIKVCSDHGQGVIGFLYDTIPADIAEKLGIEPKAEVNF